MDAFGTAALAAVVAAWRDEQVFEVGTVPSIPPTPYISMSVSSGSTENYRLSAEHGSRSYRIAVQAIGKTAGEVDFAVGKSDAAFIDQTLTVPDFDCTRVQVESASPLIRDPDGGVLLSKTLTYTFTAYPTE